MNTQKLAEVMSWVKSTDLVEISYAHDKDGFTLATSEASPTPHYPLPQSRYTPICSPSVGIFQWNAPGKAAGISEGSSVETGALLGVVETGKGRLTEVRSPCAGRIARMFVEAGAALEFGQPLFFVEPA